MKRLQLSLAIGILFISIIACTDFTLTNTSNRAVTVSVNLPDGSSSLLTLEEGASKNWFVVAGGGYTVDILPTEEYLEGLKLMENLALSYLFADPSDLSAELAFFEGWFIEKNNPFSALAALNNIQERIQSEVEGSQCSGTLPDPDLGSSEATTYTWNVSLRFNSGTWICGSKGVISD